MREGEKERWGRTVGGREGRGEKVREGGRKGGKEKEKEGKECRGTHILISSAFKVAVV